MHILSFKMESNSLESLSISSSMLFGNIERGTLASTIGLNDRKKLPVVLTSFFIPQNTLMTTRLLSACCSVAVSLGSFSKRSR